MSRPSLRAHLAIARADHWVKNVFVLPGCLLAVAILPAADALAALPPVLLGLASVCLIASSNYTINEILDAPFDRLHPTKHTRPVSSGRVSIRLAYAQWLLLMAVGMALAWAVSPMLAATMAALWLMGCVYNIPPVRTKDLPYLDVLSESVNNPLRLVAGWSMVLAASDRSSWLLPPASLLLSYWFVGCYFMAIKRFAEFREIGDPSRAAAYRRSFAHYNEQRLLVSIIFHAAASMLFFGAFIMRYRLELVLSFPLVAVVMAVYFKLAYQRDSAVQAPEKLYREPTLMAACLVCAVAMTALTFIDLPWFRSVMAPGIARPPGGAP
ncbi:MAG: UbiA family prenyltransferase [Phycisphaerales bacterium]|nr:UbiA family prenyltransferase [Phycisphaerales bacterium]